MVSGQRSVLITQWEGLGIQSWVPLSELQGQGRPGFHEHREVLFACLPAIAGSGVGPVQKTVFIVDIRHQRHGCQ